MMKLFAKYISLLVFIGLLAGCEKFELDDHCPEEEGPMINPQELRVNDDMDSEDDVIQVSKSIKSDGVDADGSTSTNGTNDADDSPDNDGDDLVNDDSDDEDEGVRPRNPGGSSPK